MKPYKAEARTLDELKEGLRQEGDVICSMYLHNVEFMVWKNWTLDNEFSYDVFIENDESRFTSIFHDTDIELLLKFMQGIIQVNDAWKQLQENNKIINFETLRGKHGI